MQPPLTSPPPPPVQILSPEGIQRLADEPSRFMGWASILLFIVVSPVGLLLGILSLRKARRIGDRQLRTLGIIGTILNSLGVLALLLVLMGVLIGGDGVPAGALRIDTLGGNGLSAGTARSAQLTTALRRELVSGFAKVNPDVVVRQVRCRPGARSLRFTCDTTLRSKSNHDVTVRTRLAVTTNTRGHWSVAGVS